jgi:hypothetical protein
VNRSPLLLRFKQNWKLLIICQLNTAVSVFFKIHSVVLELLHAGRRTNMAKEDLKGSFLLLLVRNTAKSKANIK